MVNIEKRRQAALVSLAEIRLGNGDVNDERIIRTYIDLLERDINLLKDQSFEQQYKLSLIAMQTHQILSMTSEDHFNKGSRVVDETIIKIDNILKDIE